MGNAPSSSLEPRPIANPARRPEQIRTRKTTVVEIMASPEFRRGFEGARAGAAFDWRINEWDYERGRLFAFIAPLDMPLRIGRELNLKAIALCEAAVARRLVI